MNMDFLYLKALFLGSIADPCGTPMSFASTSRSKSPADVQKEREASKLRLLDIWSSLAERYTRRLDEDDIVDIRTGEITQDRGFIRNSRKVDFGAIAAPVTGDATADEGTDDEEDEYEEDEYDIDELDAFADTTSDAEQNDIELRVIPVPPVMGPADAEDLREFLEAEQRRKRICGSEVEEDNHSAPETQSQGSEVEDEDATNSAFYVESASEDELCGNEVEEDNHSAPETQSQGSEVEDEDAANSALYVESASEDELDNWDINESSVVYPVSKGLELDKLGHQPSTPRKRKRVSSDSGSVETSVMARAERHPPQPKMFTPPIPDPRAQFIIIQAMQQLSALVGTPWTSPHDSSSIPYTPSRQHHPHPYPYSYDPNLSLPTLPPDSPESASSPVKSSHKPRKSSMARSRSRGRRVSFKLEDDESGDDDGGCGRGDVHSSPSNIAFSRREAVRAQVRQNAAKGKGKVRAETPNSEASSEDLLDFGIESHEQSYSRGRTPGPNIGPPKTMRGRDVKGRLKPTWKDRIG